MSSMHFLRLTLCCRIDQTFLDASCERILSQCETVLAFELLIAMPLVLPASSHRMLLTVACSEVARLRVDLVHRDKQIWLCNYLRVFYRSLHLSKFRYLECIRRHLQVFFTILDDLTNVLVGSITIFEGRSSTFGLSIEELLDFFAFFRARATV